MTLTKIPEVPEGIERRSLLKSTTALLGLNALGV